ncbi:alginate O-acetyltransferase AlgX-related protein [Hymenobacter sp. GOD-10R]|uniref:alginate O-acetyltransferase AlgX-related protein n=1 Tax=Hymenobacter sp. GOD-10R TaxID=3093922 RepID=UPI002D786D0E|nr:hypothetical protein [Hymenobacter sp. GOD-10R]WRQ28288.1 hypothetical protein SD425_24785 [Hymenobacter sp. GOD-10R]
MPALQAKFHWLEEAPLAGAYTMAPHPELTPNALVAGEYQPQLEKYLEDRVGFRTWLIRMRDQLSLSLLGVARSTDLLVGRDNVLFQPLPVNAYLGKNFLGEEEIRYRVRRMRIVQQELTKRGIPFLFVMAPNKARYQPEDLPAYLRHVKRGPTNYDIFIREMQANKINLLDLSRLFALWKDTTRYPLFPRGGTHWSGYGVALVADTLFARVEQVGGFDLVNFRREGPVKVTSDSVQGTDNDLSGPMNLMFPYQHYKMAYPRVIFDSLQAGQQRPNLLISGDSFVWGFMHFDPYLQTLFTPESRFWGVDETVFIYDTHFTRTGEDLNQGDFRQQIEPRQFIMMLVTEHNLIYGRFIDRLYELYHPLTEADNSKIKVIEQQLMSQPGYSDSLWARANRENRGFEEVLQGEARTIYDHTER